MDGTELGEGDVPQAKSRRLDLPAALGGLAHRAWGCDWAPQKGSVREGLSPQSTRQQSPEVPDWKVHFTPQTPCTKPASPLHQQVASPAFQFHRLGTGMA